MRLYPRLKVTTLLCFLLLVIALSRCAGMGRMEESHVTVEEHDLVKVYTLKRGGIKVKILDRGAIVMSFKTPDKIGQVDDIVLGFDKPATYVEGNPSYFGAILGRVANRIANASFRLDGSVYKLPANDGPNTIHGGLIGFDKVHWQSQILDNGLGPSVQFTYNSSDGEQGFPGDLQVSVTYTLSKNAEFKIEMKAEPGKKSTPVNLASHSYWNLKGQGNGNVLDHRIQIFGSSYTPVDDNWIPTGEIVPVEGTTFDFLEEHPIGSRIAEIPGPPPGGYDHNYVLVPEDGLKKAARVVDPVSGRVMELWTTAPGMQFYTGNYLEGVVGKGEVVYQTHGAFCLETQGFPNAINEPRFPSVVVQPGQVYRHIMVYRFSTL